MVLRNACPIFLPFLPPFFVFLLLYSSLFFEIKFSFGTNTYKAFNFGMLTLFFFFSEWGVFYSR